MFRTFRRFVFAVAFAAPVAMAQTDQAPEAKDDEPFPILTATCDDVYDLFEEATPADGKDPKELEEAQDDVLSFVIWVHGYLSGRDGIDLEKRPMGKQGIVTTIEHMARVCDPDGSRLFLDAVEDLK